jgi:uncharacterized protein involved in exopolysaccharide biosynthesis
MQLVRKGKKDMAKISLLKSFINSIKDLKGPASTWSDKAYKHITKHPAKYAAGTTAVVSYGVFKEHGKMKPKLRKAFGALPPHDARYKSLKKAGYISKKQHRKNLSLWRDAGYPTV